MGALLADYHSLPGITVNRLCASGLSVLQAARSIQVGDADVVVAGGVESMSRAPWVMPKASSAFPVGNVTVFDTSLGWRFPNPAMEAMFPLEAMGNTAENLVDRYGITREDQDEWALKSHEKALAAQQNGAFSDEILPVTVPRRKQELSSLMRMKGHELIPAWSASSLRPAFRKDGGSVTQAIAQPSMMAVPLWF